MKLSKRALAISPSLTLKIDSMYKELRRNGHDVVGFGTGEPDFDTPEYIKEAAIRAITEGKTKYTPASGIPELKQAVCKRYLAKYDLEYLPTQVTISSGAKHSLYNIMQAMLNPGDEVIILAPYWLTYPELVRMALGEPVIVETSEENGFEPTRESLDAALTEHTRAIVVNSPSNPCGCVYSRETLAMIADFAKEADLTIIADEIYDELVYDGECASIAAVSEDAKERTVIVNGVSKAYAMTGWRIGYTIAPMDMATVMASYQSQATSNPCSVAQYASVAALNGPQDDLKKMVSVFAERRNLMHSLLTAIPGVEIRRPAGAFYALPNISSTFGKSYKGEKIEGSISFAELLLRYKLTAVVPGAAFGADEYIRLSYAESVEDIKRGVARIAEFISELED